jgi:ElaB/YqjD/DUF883 family membrane-anchored ribosome-binding protein
MGQGEGQARPAVGNPDPDQIKEEIEETREELGDPVAAVTNKADVRKQAKASGGKETAGEIADRARRFAQQNPVPTGLGGAFAVGLLVGWLVRWR